MIQIKKTLLTLVALLAVTTGAWADETPLLTIESKDYTSFTSGSKTFDDKVTVTFSNKVENDGDDNGWYSVGPSLLTVAGTNGYTITSCKFYIGYGNAMTGYTVQGKSPSVYLNVGDVYTDNSESVYLGAPGIKKIEVFGGVASASSGPKVDWDKNTGKFTMPGGNVTLEPEYYPQAVLTAEPTAINDVPATTDGAIVKAGTVKNIGETETAQGTVMYYVSPTALDDDALLALAADKWTADVPTAESLAQGQAYVYYYVRGNDSDTDAENFSDGDILAANALTVTIAAEPTYAVTFAEGTPETDKWTAEPNAGVKKGETVTVTYTGSKKVIGVKVAKALAYPIAISEVTSDYIGSVVTTDGNVYATVAAATAASKLPVAMIAYVGTESDCAHGLAIALADESGTKKYEAAGTAFIGKIAVTGGTWRLPSIKDWQYMFIGCGASGSYSDNPSPMSYSGLTSKLTTVQGDALQGDASQVGGYWSSTESTVFDTHALVVVLDGSNANFYAESKETLCQVRACLAF